MREASAKSTRVKVASARSLTVSPSGAKLHETERVRPDEQADAGEHHRRRDRSSRDATRDRGEGQEAPSARVASAHVTAGSDGDAYRESRDPDDGAEEEDATQCDGDLP